MTLRRIIMIEKAENYNLITAFISMYKKYAVFSGRSRRSEYWYAQLGIFLISMGISLLTNGLIAAADIARSTFPPLAGVFITMQLIFSFASMMFSFSLIVPSLALRVRRFHDVGKSGLLLLLYIIPYLGIIVCMFSFVFLIFAGNTFNAAGSVLSAAAGRYGLSPEFFHICFTDPAVSVFTGLLISVFIFYFMLLVLGIIFFIFTVLDSKPGPNKYGPNPKGIN